MLLMLSTCIAQQSGDSTNNYFYIVQIQDAYYDSLIDIYGIDSMQGTGYKDYVRWKGYMQMRVDDDGTLDTYMNSINDYYDQTNPTSTTDWTYYSPVGEPEEGSLNGFGKGWVNQVLYDEANNDIYAGTHNNGIWKTSNSGYDWERITQKQPKINGVASMCFNSNNDIYALTHSNIAFYSNGLYKGVYNGSEWDWAEIEIEIDGSLIYPMSMKKKYYPRKVLVHPDNDNVLFVLTKRYVFKSDDSGDTWAVLYDFGSVENVEGCEDLFFDTENLNTMYVAGTKILKSINNGNDWDEITQKVTQDIIGFEKVITCKMDVNSAYPGKVWFYYTYKDIADITMIGITKYDYAGDSYEVLFTNEDFNNLNSGSGKMDIIVHPEFEDRIYVAGLHIMAAYPNSGNSFKFITSNSYDDPNYLHMDVRDMMFYNPPYSEWKMLIGCDGGVVEADEENGGNDDWVTTDLSIQGATHATDLNISEIYAISTSGNKGKIAFNCQDIGGYFYNNDVLNRFHLRDGGAVLFDNIYDEYIYLNEVTSGFFAYNTIEQNFVNINVPYLDDSYLFPPIVKDPGNANVAYFGSKKLWRYNDIYAQLETGNEIAEKIVSLQNSSSITDIAISHNNPDIMYVSTKNFFWDEYQVFEDAFYKSTDGVKHGKT